MSGLSHSTAPPVGSGGGGVTDHGELTGLLDDDHTQYLLKNGNRALTADWTVGSHKIRGLSDPALAQDAATKNYVDTAITTAANGDIKSNGSVAFTADQSMGGFKLTNVADPADAQDATTKNYVDAAVAAVSGVTDHGALTGLADDDHPQYLRHDGTRPLSADWDAGSFAITGSRFVSTVAVGTAPFTVTSTTAVTNLNADLLDGQHAADFAAAGHNHDHGSLTGLGDDDHTQYLLVDGSRPMAAALNMLSGATRSRIVGLGDPISGTDAAHKTYVDDGLATKSDTGHTHDHGDLTGLSDDDHEQYLLANGTRQLSGDWNTGGFGILATQFTAASPLGVAPFLTDSTTLCTGLNADFVDGKHAIDLVLLDGSQAMTGALDMGTTNKIINLADPTLDQDAATKAYVDAHTAGINDHGSLTGLEDDDHPQYLLADGSRALTGDLVANTHKITGVVDPVDPQDAATKNYVDSKTYDHGALTGLGDDDHGQYLRTDGTRQLSGSWDAGGFNITANKFISTATTGTAPFTVASTTNVPNLNASSLKGFAPSAFIGTVSVGGMLTRTAGGSAGDPVDITLGTQGHKATIQRTTAQTIPHATSTKVLFNTTAVNVGGIADIANSQIVIARTGNYLVAGGGYFTSGVSNVQTDIRVNAASVGAVVHTDNTDAFIFVPIVRLVSLTAGDIVDLVTQQSNTGTATRDTVTGGRSAFLTVIELP